MAADTENAVYQFRGFRLDPLRRKLSAPDDSPIALKPKVFETLVYLVEHRGELLPKDALMKAVWGRTLVEENSLNQNISALRRAFGEVPGDNRFIVTVPGRGYQFVARVIAAEERMREVCEIAVLPFDCLTPGQSFFCRRHDR